MYIHLHVFAILLSLWNFWAPTSRSASLAACCRGAIYTQRFSCNDPFVGPTCVVTVISRCRKFITTWKIEAFILPFHYYSFYIYNLIRSIVYWFSCSEKSSNSVHCPTYAAWDLRCGRANTPVSIVQWTNRSMNILNMHITTISYRPCAK